MLFNQDGFFCIDELVNRQPTFRKIMEDGVVTEKEVEDQGALVISMLKQIEAILEPEKLKVVEQLLAEMSVLSAIQQYRELQDIHQSL